MTRHARMIAAALVSIVLVAAACAVQAAVDYDVRREATTIQTLRFGGSGERTLDVKNLHGSIRVTAVDSMREVVELETRRTIEAVSAAEAARAEDLDGLSFIDGLATIEIVVQERASPICGERWDNYAWQGRPRYRITYDMTIRVPARTRVRLCTINGREITVGGTIGDFDIENVNGRISLEGVRGSGRARTVNGPVTATLLDVPHGESEFMTTNGDVTVTWPASLAARLRMKTFNGGLFTDFPAVPVDANRAAPIERRDGRFVYRSNQFTEVQVGRGGADVTLGTFNGDVRVLRATR